MWCRVWWVSRLCLLRLHRNGSCFHWNPVSGCSSSGGLSLWQGSFPGPLTLGTVRANTQHTCAQSEIGISLHNCHQSALHRQLQKASQFLCFLHFFKWKEKDIFRKSSTLVCQACLSRLDGIRGNRRGKDESSRITAYLKGGWYLLKEEDAHCCYLLRSWCWMLNQGLTHGWQMFYPQNWKLSIDDTLI